MTITARLWFLVKFGVMVTAIQSSWLGRLSLELGWGHAVGSAWPRGSYVGAGDIGGAMGGTGGFGGVVVKIASIRARRNFGAGGGGGIDPVGGGDGEVSAKSAASYGSDYHVPVLMNEVLEYLDPGEGRLILDGTLGGAGHSEALLRAGARVIGLDQDPAAIREAEQRLAGYGDAFTAFQMNFREFGRALDDEGVGGLDGMLLDLGVSSHQIDTAERGFSFQADGRLDMRMDTTAPETAADVVNSASEDALISMFRELGEEPRARRVAKMIVEKRAEVPFETTMQLADAVESVIPRQGRRHPATKVFQALRMTVNDELGALEETLAGVRRWLKPGGVLAVITFHSLEDRIVKRFMRDASREFNDAPEWPEPRPNPDYFLRQLKRRAISPLPEEIDANPRSRSAKLRVAQRI